jgi:hypothetical protein
MSRKQGPRTAGMRPSAIAVRCRRVESGNCEDRRGGINMRSEQGPRAAGMRSPVHVVHVRLLPGGINSPDHSLLEVGHGH